MKIISIEAIMADYKGHMFIHDRMLCVYEPTKPGKRRYIPIYTGGTLRGSMAIDDYDMDVCEECQKAYEPLRRKHKTWT